MQINGKKEGLDEVLDAGVEVYSQTLESLRKRGIDFDSTSSVLAVAVAGAMAYEELSEEQFLSIVHETLKLWRREVREEGVFLVFSNGLAPTADQLQIDAMIGPDAGSIESVDMAAN